MLFDLGGVLIEVAGVRHIAGWPLAGLFDHRFLSFELGVLSAVA